ncbi:MAG: hypothetical protein HQK97_00540 [Nitrospirae bacterium]|nr:hypothetical protein [Nitrospirota bacterium]
MNSVMQRLFGAFSKKEPTHEVSQSDVRLSLRVVYNRFRQLLNTNNHALEIMADMGNKLGGNYIFDINYIKKSYTEFSDTLFQSIYNLNALSENKYLYLHRVFERINTQVNRILQDKPAADLKETVMSYKQITWEMADEVGGKNAAVAELGNYLKLNIPEGFAITAGAFREFIEYNHIDDKIESLRKEFELGGNGVDGAFFDKARQIIRNGQLPQQLEAAVNNALLKLNVGGSRPLAVRSSAQKEDSDVSFAGQFESVLNVPANLTSISEAYKRVLASLYSPEVAAYQSHAHAEDDAMMTTMSVGCIKMVDSRIGGVMYSIDPNDIDRDVVIISGSWGLGTTVAEGSVDADVYVVQKNEPFNIIERKIGDKAEMDVNGTTGGIVKVPVAQSDRVTQCLSDTQIRELARHAVMIEHYFKKPQDIEWTFNDKKELFFLQSRPLRYSAKPIRAPKETISASLQKYEVIMERQGIIGCRGIGAGKVFHLRHMEDLKDFKCGSVLVAKHDSSQFIKIMPKAAAIITEIGTPTSHMANIAREFRVPTIVNAGIATSMLQDGQEITVDAEDNKVYAGKVKELLRYNITEDIDLTQEKEFKILKKILRYMAPLNLTDPGSFSAEACQTFHDILRFIHEKAIEELTTNTSRYKEILHDKAAVRLDIPAPIDICVIDIGGGLIGGNAEARRQQIASIPFQAIVEGMSCPYIWNWQSSDSIAMPVSHKKHMPSALCFDGDSVAVVSQDYVNLTIRSGKQGNSFNMLDCYCGENVKDNHVYYRFTGAAPGNLPNTTGNSGKAQLIADILRELDMRVSTKGGIVLARADNISRLEMEILLNYLGRLIAYAWHFDAIECNDQTIRHYATNFLVGKYDLRQA